MNRSFFSTPKTSMVAKMLTLLACLVLSQAAYAEQLLPSQNAVHNGFQPLQLETLMMMKIDTPSWMFGTMVGVGWDEPDDPKDGPVLDPVPGGGGSGGGSGGHNNFPLDCNNWDSNYCNYYYPGDGCCCVAQVLIPNSFCPDICV